MDFVAPLAARIADLPVEMGSSARPSDKGAVLEVMKMEQPVKADVSHTLSSLAVLVRSDSEGLRPTRPGVKRVHRVSF